MEFFECCLFVPAILNLFKDSLTLIGLLCVMFYQNWKLSLIAIIMIPLASAAARTLGKRIGKVVTEQMNKAGVLTSYLIEIFKTSFEFSSLEYQSVIIIPPL